MNHDFWLERWKLGQLGFHRDSPHPLLQRFWPELGVSGGRVLVPLCGKSTDLDWLAARDHDVVGVEFVPQAVEDYFAERGLTPEREQRESFPVAKNGRVCLIVGDFFAVHAGVTGVCDAAYDRGAWVAIAPEDREKYVARIHSLLRPGGRILLVNFEHDVGSGPPHSIPQNKLEALWKGFSLELHLEHDILVDEPRFRERGATHFLEQAWLGTRDVSLSRAD
jgi:thiopurine S-methyltransferase